MPPVHKTNLSAVATSSVPTIARAFNDCVFTLHAPRLNISLQSSVRIANTVGLTDGCSFTPTVGRRVDSNGNVDRVYLHPLLDQVRGLRDSGRCTDAGTVPPEVVLKVRRQARADQPVETDATRWVGDGSGTWSAAEMWSDRDPCNGGSIVLPSASADTVSRAPHLAMVKRDRVTLQKAWDSRLRHPTLAAAAAIPSIPELESSQPTVSITHSFFSVAEKLLSLRATGGRGGRVRRLACIKDFVWVRHRHKAGRRGPPDHVASEAHPGSQEGV